MTKVKKPLTATAGTTMRDIASQELVNRHGWEGALSALSQLAKEQDMPRTSRKLAKLYDHLQCRRLAWKARD